MGFGATYTRGFTVLVIWWLLSWKPAFEIVTLCGNSWYLGHGWVITNHIILWNVITYAWSRFLLFCMQCHNYSWLPRWWVNDMFMIKITLAADMLILVTRHSVCGPGSAFQNIPPLTACHWWGKHDSRWKQLFPRRKQLSRIPWLLPKEITGSLWWKMSSRHEHDGAVITPSVFSQNSHNRHPIACHHWRAMGCLLWDPVLIYAMPQSMQYYKKMLCFIGPCKGGAWLNNMIGISWQNKTLLCIGCHGNDFVIIFSSHIVMMPGETRDYHVSLNMERCNSLIVKIHVILM